MRLFLAINLPQSIKSTLAKELPRFDYLKFRPIPSKNWHITLKFIGDVEKSAMALIHESIQSVVKNFKPFELVIQDIGFLNRRIFAFKLEKSAKLFALFRMVDQKLAAREMAPPEHYRHFTPHITVGRKHPPVEFQLHSLRHFDLKARRPVSFRAKSLDLMESTLTEKGSMYQLKEQYLFKI